MQARHRVAVQGGGNLKGSAAGRDRTAQDWRGGWPDKSLPFSYKSLPQLPAESLPSSQTNHCRQGGAPDKSLPQFPYKPLPQFPDKPLPAGWGPRQTTAGEGPARAGLPDHRGGGRCGEGVTGSCAWCSSQETGGGNLGRPKSLGAGVRTRQITAPQKESLGEGGVCGGRVIERGGNGASAASRHPSIPCQQGSGERRVLVVVCVRADRRWESDRRPLN